MTTESIQMLEEKEERLPNAVLAKALWPYIRPYAWMILLATLLVFVVTFFELMLPILIQRGIDGFIVPAAGQTGIDVFGYQTASFDTFCLIFLSFIVIGFLVDFSHTLFLEYTGQKIILNLRCKLFSHMTGLPVAYFDKNASGRLVSRVAGDVENMNEMFTSILVFIFRDLMIMAGVLAILFSIHGTLTLYVSLVVPVIGVGILYFSTALRKVFRTIRQKISEINHTFSEGISGIQAIQTTASRSRFKERFNAINQAHFEAAMTQIKIFAVFMPFIGFLGMVSTAVIIWGGSFSVMDQTLTIGELVAFLTYMKLFFRPLRELSEKFNLLQSALASAERLVTVLSRPPARKRLTQDRTKLDTIHSLSFENVDFSYLPGEPVLKEISFSLDAGKSIGIAGRTGSGKSSIINLITGFYRPDSGRIRLNGLSHDAINIDDIRKKTALVMQDPILFSGTVRENIRPDTEHDDRDIPENDLKAALDKANCGFLFQKFDGLDTRLKEGGRPLSSGEKQLVCIARAFAFDPDLIIFDEATSYMDSGSEKKVHDAMQRLMKGRISIIIAHRLSTIRDCDTILLLGDGRILERGSHKTLVKRRGPYYRLLQKERV